MTKLIKIRQSSSVFDLEMLKEFMNPIKSIHPELLLEDNSIIIFPNQKSYYNFISNPDLFSSNNVNVEKLIKKFPNKIFCPNNEISYDGLNISKIFGIEYNTEKLCYIIRE